MLRKGGCLCGAVRFKAEGEPLNVRVCHCRTCQKAMGSPFFARAQFDQRALTVEGDTARYASSENIDRVFCKQCGTRLFAWRRNGTLAGVSLSVFDDRNAFAPTEHIWVSEKPDWLKLDDGLTQHPGTILICTTPRRADHLRRGISEPATLCWAEASLHRRFGWNGCQAASEPGRTSLEHFLL